jgi:predicted SAM-dependent methyltransferase
MIKLPEPILEVGGGGQPSFRPNMDVRPLPTVDIVANLEEPFPIPDESYGSVYGHYVIEHLSWPTVRQFIAECHRVLVPGGTCVHVTADTEAQCKLALETEGWTEEISNMLFGGQDYSDNTHKNALSPEYAARMFRECGFYEVIIHPHPVSGTDMIIEAIKSSAVIRIG